MHQILARKLRPSLRQGNPRERTRKDVEREEKIGSVIPYVLGAGILFTVAVIVRRRKKKEQAPPIAPPLPPPTQP